MANGRKTGGKNFGAGNNANPDGRPPLPADVREVRNITQEEFFLTINKLAKMTAERLRDRISDPTTPSLELAVATVLAAAIQKGDHVRLNAILDRLIGRPKFTVELSGADGNPIRYTDMSEKDFDEKLNGFNRRLDKYKARRRKRDRQV